MTKVRFLESAYVIPLNQVFGYDDELEIEDKNLANTLKEHGMVDILDEVEEQPDIQKEKPDNKIEKKPAKKKVKIDA